MIKRLKYVNFDPKKIVGGWGTGLYLYQNLNHINYFPNSFVFVNQSFRARANIYKII